MIVAFNFNTFKIGFFEWMDMDHYHFISANTMSQVKSTMLVTVWVFIGIEGAVVFSGRAKNKKMLNCHCYRTYFSIAHLLLLTVLAQGIVIQNHISKLEAPSMAQILAYIVGDWEQHLSILVLLFQY